MSLMDSRASGWFDPQGIPVGEGKSPVKVDWINPISMSMLQKAVKRKAATVVMNGIEYGITYDLYLDLPASGERREVVKLKRTDGGYAPFGYVSVSRIKRFQFEDEDG